MFNSRDQFVVVLSKYNENIQAKEINAEIRGGENFYRWQHQSEASCWECSFIKFIKWAQKNNVTNPTNTKKEKS